MPFGQVVIGPPGSGKTAYCNGMQQFLKLVGRKIAVANLDPANDFLPYECAVNIEELVKLSDVMSQYNLGPNGGLVYCMDYLEKNLDWLLGKLRPLAKDHYFLFDFPGQVELFTLHSSCKNILDALTMKHNYRLVAVHLVDSHLCTDPHKYVAAVMLSLSTMLHMGLPHVNVLSKIDLVESYGKLAFNLNFYTEVQDLGYLQMELDKDPLTARFKKMNQALCEVVEEYALVSFETLHIEDKESMLHLMRVIDKANGYAFARVEMSTVEYSKVAAGISATDLDRVGDIQEKYMS